MNHIFDIALKDLKQIVRDRKTFLFLLIMPVAFTLLFGWAFGSSGKASDDRLPVGFLDQDNSALSQDLAGLMQASTLLRLDQDARRSAADLDQLVADGDLAAAVIVPQGYEDALRSGSPLPLTVLADPSQTTSAAIQNDVLAAANRLASAARTAQIVSAVTGSDSAAAFEAALNQALAAWQEPPIQVTLLAGNVAQEDNSTALSMAHSSPAMMLQFAIAGLISAATILVNERKTRSLQRLLTTATSRTHILIGHYLAMFSMIFAQFVILIAFGQLLLKVDYLRLPLATLLVAVAAAACISALGLLVGVFAKSEEQTVILVLVPMFVLSGLGGAWMPLEYTAPAFQSIGHASPVAWAMDGFENVAARGLDFGSVLLPAAALAGYALLFFALAAWRFRRMSE